MILGILISFLFICVNLNAESNMSEVERIYTEFKELNTENMDVYRIDSMEIKVDASTMLLKNGYFYAFRPVNDQNVFGAFRGDIHFILKSDAKDAIRQFRNVIEKDYYEDSFEEVFITDTRGLIGRIKKDFQKVSEYPQYKNIDLKMSKMGISYGSTLELWDNIVSKLIKDADKDYCRYDMINDHKHNKVVCYAFFSGNNKENFLHFIPADNTFKKTIKNNVWFHRKGDYEKYGDRRIPEKKKNTDIEKYNLNVEITKDWDLICEGSMDFTLKYGSSRWLDIDIGYLHNMKKFQLEYITDLDGNPLEHFQKEENIWVKLPESNTDSKHQIKFKYKAPFITKYNGVSGSTRSHSYWFPYIPSETKYLAELKFTYPKKYNLFTVGERISEEKKGKMKVSVWKTSEPVGHIDFSLAKYKQSIETRAGLPEACFFMDKSRNENIDMMMNFMEIMTKVIGKLDLERVNLVESNGLDYNIPGYVVLQFAEISTNWGNSLKISELNNMLFAYPIIKISELWWGKTIKAYTSNDSWMIHALPEITSLLLIHKCDPNGSEVYNDCMNIYMESIKGTYNKYIKCGIFQDAIYDNFSESKSVYVLHLLRYYLMKTEKKNDDVFITALRTLYADYKGKKASTEDFISIVNRISGEDMDWFFEQWVYGNRLPEIEYDYSSVNENGVYYLQLNITQSGVGDDFKSRIPVRVTYSNGQASTFNVDVTGKSYSKKIKLPMEMNDFEFDVFNTVIFKKKK